MLIEAYLEYTDEEGVELIHQLNHLLQKGILLNNLFQLDNGIWRASLRDDKGTFEFGEATIPSMAVKNALSRLSGPRLPFLQNVDYSREKMKSFDDFLSGKE